MKAGDKIKIVLTYDEDYWKVGDTATLHHQDSDGDWWADFNENERVVGDGIWCIGPEDFVLADPIETRPDIGEEDILP